MYESDAEVEALQQLLDASHAGSTEHLRSIIGGRRVLAASDLVALLTGMRVLSVATVTASGEPRISAVDGHFLHGTWSFSTSGTAAKARHLRDRPAASVAHVDNEQLAVFSHGHVEELAQGDGDFDETLAHWTQHYGGSPLEWGDDIRIYRYRPHWMIGYAWKYDELMAERGLTPRPQ
ncbi:pyridoxamine 5'-phosphate oxidase family protein [Nocardioides acrostichi]|uniref:Pyridoxamine 5'-phosphate oxidase family protein n=1 Tax=Nocardioides acrostichi TaxID=2784339 RepID=A0A930Y7H6_9ACTN|nr:pyridoxamine 5'-phosphate oxidase family protein [Nocardioides acrostichi]MBF4163430.1 pyridoxamine 5'-phosphate oxidase family protein [Nocardioides acrostichi]